MPQALALALVAELGADQLESHRDSRVDERAHGDERPFEALHPARPGDRHEPQAVGSRAPGSVGRPEPVRVDTLTDEARLRGLDAELGRSAWRMTATRDGH